MSFQGSHLILLHTADIESATKAVGKFFDETLLLQYDSVQCQRGQSFSAAQPHFWQEMEDAIEQNRQVLHRFLAELAEDGVRALGDLKNVTPGYQSKLLHIIAHFLDGFIGIDTVFYNLLEESHWLTEMSRKSILADPDHYWLIHVDTTFRDRKTASFV